jgi:hypothetical protein
MRKGYLFTMDAVFSALILIISAIIILNQLPKPSTDYFTDRMGADVINVLSHTQTTELCSISDTSCNCYKYVKLEAIVCSPVVRNREAGILDVFSEVILTGAVSSKEIEDAIHEIFVTKNVIDEKRFGFAVLYSTPGSVAPLELYNTETYTP